jgi:hypothetical protein
MVQTPMSETTYRGRRAFQIENDTLRLTVLSEGGHIAQMLHKASGVNPLWTPPWRSIEPSTYQENLHPEYGSNSESKLLAGIMGHNLCLDLFGGPSEAEAAAGITVHGEASVAPYTISTDGDEMITTVHVSTAQLHFERRLTLDGGAVHITETVHNCAAMDRPIAWTQHVTLGPPFLVPGETEFDVPVTRSQGLLGETIRPQTYTHRAGSGGYTAYLLDPERDDAWFTAWSPGMQLWIGYCWKRADFPWIGFWEENCSRQSPPWNGETVTRGMEFGVSPMPETRRAMIERGSMFGVPAFTWVPAKRSVQVHYSAYVAPATSPAAIHFPLK